MSGHAIQTQQLGVRLGTGASQRQVLQGVDVALQKSRWTAIVGPNGAGKSTLLKAMVGLLPYQGKVTVLGQDARLWPARARAQRVAWLGQNEGMTEDLCVYDVAMLGRLPHQSWLSAPSAADHAAVQDALQSTQAWDWRQRRMNELSGGERQRVLLARALAVQADVLLMDEPLASLDPPHQTDWLHLMRRLVAQGTTVVSVLHELHMALHADSLLVLAGGQVMHQGGSADLATHAALQAVFDEKIQIQSLSGQWVVLSKIQPYSVASPDAR